MKLRLYGDSIRLRLSPSDIETLRHTGQIGEVTHFGGQSQIAYRLEINSRVENVHVYFDGANVVVQLSKSAMEKWSGSDEVSIRHEQSLHGGGWLKILIEKDFECLHSDEKEPGLVLFPNPNQGVL